MLRLTDLALAVGGEIRGTAADNEVRGVSYDSRKISPGDVFVAISGLKDDGSKYVRDAIAKGAVAVIQDRSSRNSFDVPVIAVETPRAALAKAAWNIAGNPNKKLKLVGITGTNGKTTVSAALAKLLTICDRPCGVCGTLGMFFGEYKFDSDRTTAEAPELAAAFSDMLSRGATHVTLEATSIGLVMHRLDELQFDVGILTNMSRDHLDFHGTWENYRQAKLMLFESDRLSGTAVINADDPEADLFLRHTKRPSLTYGLNSNSDFSAMQIQLRADGTIFHLQSPEGRFEACTALIGQFNVYNTLAIIAGAYALGLPVKKIVETLPELTHVRGRAEVVRSAAPFAVLVDYAHTPDALEKILSTVRELTKGKLHCVVGAGGDRDKGKRPLMAQAAEKYSDVVYLTSDNPRTEEPQSILDDMLAGVKESLKVRANPDRRQAINTALASGHKGDVVVVAGKGHETYQEIHGVKHPFDDADVIREWLRDHEYLK
jgi:UDP-N-acetylmuramoyl-L-alanyl-D-glutamate--2,6-diaminopimelate ligase